MHDIKVSRAARSDLDAINEYGAERFGNDLAEDYSRGFTQALELLSRHPYAGQARPDYGKDARCKDYRRHRILYRVAGDTVFVQRVLHHSQHVPAHLEQ